AEPQATSDVDGNYRFDGLLPGDYSVSVSPVAGYATPADFDTTVQPEFAGESDSGSVVPYDLAIQQLSLSQIRGQLTSEMGDPIPYWKVFADLNGDGVRDAVEPMTMSDRDGHYAITALGADDYNIKPDLPAGWADSAGTDGLNVTLGVDEVLTNNDFTLRPTNTSVTAGLHFVTEAPASVEARQVYRYASVAFAIGDVDPVYDLSLAPEGMVVDPATGLIAWRPAIGQVGQHTVIVRATAGDSIALQDFTIDVTAPNFAPVVTSLPGKTAYLNTPHQFDIAAQDVESEALTFTLVGQDHGASVDATTGRFSWTPSSAGTFDFVLRVTDESNASVEETFTMVVADVVPALSLVGLSLPRDKYPVGQKTIGRVSAIDSLGRSVDWSIDNAPIGLTVQPDGTLEWTPATTQLGSHDLQLVATTAEGTELEVVVTVEVTGSLINSPPVIDSDPIGSAVLGRSYAYDIVASDADRDPLSFALLEAPAGMSIDPLRGTIRWTPSDDQLGESDVVIRVADTFGAETTQSYKLLARRFGGPPIIQSVPASKASVGSAYFYSIAARDAERDPLTYRLLDAPAGMTISESTGEIAWTPASDQTGLQTVAIEVSDGVGGAGTQAFAILVSDGAPNLPPVINSEAPKFAAVGTQYEYTIDAQDPESTTLTYVLSVALANMSVDASGRITWTPVAGEEGKVPVTIRVIDEGGAAAIESFELDVLAQNIAPVVDSTAPTTATAGAEFKYDVLASDANTDALTFELTQGPAAATIDVFGRIRWTPSVADVGDHDFEVAVRDPRGGAVTQAFTLSVAEDTDAPRVSLIETPDDASRNVLPWMGPFVVYAKAIDNVEVASLTLQANGQDIPLSAAGTATFTFEDWVFDTISATATAIDTSGNVTTRTITFNYDVPEGWSTNPGPEVPTAVITSPSDNGTAVGMVSITGTADHEDFGAYTLSYRRADETSFTEILRSTTPVVDGELGVWDTSLLLNDEYVIRLQVATTEGTANVVEHNVGLAGELKLGNFRLSFTDMVIPVAGIPIEITRIYDTLQADREGDFGFGWRLEYRDTDLRVGLPESGLEDIGIYSALRPGVKVFLNIPGEGRQGFTFNPDIRVLPGFGGNNLVLARPRFTPDPGVTSTLATGTSGYLQVNEQGELYAPGGIPYNPASPDFGGAYVITTREGITYRVDGASGKLDSATDRNGNRLTFSASGVHNSLGTEVRFVRDSRGRITSIVDPLGNAAEYEYAGGEVLSLYRDREGHETQFLYLGDRSRYLDEVVDPLERPLHRVDYDSDGRIREVIGAGNAKFEIDYEISSRSAEFTDPLGNTRRYIYDNSGNLVVDINELGQPIQFEYDRDGRLTKTISPLGAVTNDQYDARGNLVRTVDPDGQATAMQYDAAG
ncbi:MAG: putative Ig domain-containing protein, partial [Planctomycetota bacterium]